MNDILPIPSDRDLVAAARDGSDEAWAEFVARHAPTVRAIAAATGRGASGRTDHAFADLRIDLTAAPHNGDVSDAPAVRAMRARAIAALTGGSYGPGDRSDPADLDNDDIAVTAELPALADAYSRLPEQWQSVLWHHYVDHAPAAEQMASLGRSPAAAVALRATAERGLFDAYCAAVSHGDPPPLAECRPIVPLLGAYRRGTLPATQSRAVTAHLRGGGRSGSTDDDDVFAAPAGCRHCRRRLAIADDLDTVLAPAIVPGLTGLSVDAYRRAVGASTVLGSSDLATQRADRSSRRTRILAVVAVVLALLAAAFFIRAPFEDLEPDIADLSDDSSPTTTVPSDSSRIEFVFPEEPQGAVFVPGGRPLDLSIDLASPGPMIAGGTGIVDAQITNLDTVAISTTFQVVVTPAVAFAGLAEGDGSCQAAADDGATCSISVEPGETVLLSLRFLFSAEGPDELVIDPGMSSPSLDVPVQTVPDLLIGVVERGDSRIIGGSVGPCTVGADCPDGDRNASSAILDIPAGAEVQSAVLAWEGPDPTQSWVRGVGLIPPGARQAQSINRSEVTPNSTSTSDATPPSSGFRSTADVTAAVREGGAGRYTFVRTADSSGAGSWSLTVVVTSPSMPRRVIVVTAPADLATAEEPVAVDIPLAGTTTVDDRGAATLVLQGRATSAAGTQSVTADGEAIDGADPFGLRVDGSAGGGVTSYDLDIASTEDALSLVASTTDGTLRVTVLGVTLDVAS